MVTTTPWRNPADYDPKGDIRNIKFKSGQAQYLPVAARIFWKNSTNPDWAVRTEIVSLDPSKAFACVKAEIVVPIEIDGKFHEYVIASNIGSETGGDFQDYVEKAATKAIGRALANAGFSTQEALAVDFEIEDTLEAKGRYPGVDTGVDAGSKPAMKARPTPAKVAAPAADPNRPMTDPQKTAIYGLQKKLGWDTATLDSYIDDGSGITLEGLDFETAAELIISLQGKLEQDGKKTSLVDAAINAGAQEVTVTTPKETLISRPSMIPVNMWAKLIKGFEAKGEDDRVRLNWTAFIACWKAKEHTADELKALMGGFSAANVTEYLSRPNQKPLTGLLE